MSVTHYATGFATRYDAEMSAVRYRRAGYEVRIVECPGVIYPFALACTYQP